MTPPKTINELYSVDVAEFPGLVPEIGTEGANAALDIISSVMRPASFPSAWKEKPGTPFLGPHPAADVVEFSCLKDVDDQYQIVCRDREDVCEHLRGALRRRRAAKPLSSRASSRADASTRATSRASARSASRCGASSRLSMGGDGADSHLSTRADSRLSGGADSRMSTSARADSRMSARPDSRMDDRVDSRMSARAGSEPRRWSGSLDLVEDISLMMEPSSPSAPSSRSGCTCYVPAVFPFPEPIPRGPPSRRPRRRCPLERFGQCPLHPPKKREPSAHDSDEEGREPSRLGLEALTPWERRAQAEDPEFCAMNRKKANAWITECKPLSWTPDSEKEPWVLAMQERRRACKERARMLANMESMPFDDWWEDVQEVENAVFGPRNDYLSVFNRHHEHEAQDEFARNILQQMSCHSNRGMIGRHDINVAQQVALAHLRRHWGKSTDHQKGFDSLALEVRNGNCTLGEQHGAIVRVVAVVVFSIERKGSILLELGIWKNGKAIPSPRLPGSKQQSFERTEDTLQRELQTFLMPFRPGMQLGDLTYCEYTGRSEAYGITTCYHKSVQHAVISDEFEIPQLPHVSYSAEVSQQFLKYDVFALRVKDKIRLYAFVKKDGYDYLFGDPQAKTAMEKWFSTMVIDEHAALDSLSWTTEEEQMVEKKKRASVQKLRRSLLQDIKGAFRSSKESETKRSEEKHGAPDGQDAKRKTMFGGEITEAPRKTLLHEAERLHQILADHKIIDQDKRASTAHKRRTITQAAKVLGKATSAGLRSQQTWDEDRFSPHAAHEKAIAEKTQAQVEAVLAQARQDIETCETRQVEKPKSSSVAS